MKKTWFIFLPSVLFMALVFFGYYWWRANSQSVSEDEVNVVFVVPKGKSASEIAQSLSEKNLIKDALAFKLYVQFTDKQENINAGEFILSPSMNLKEVVETLQGGPIELWVTIPEGLRREEIAEIFIDSLNKSEADEIQFRQEFMDLTQNKEGYLFPDTYLFPPDAKADKVVDRLLATFEAKTKDLKKDADSSSTHSFDEIVKMASIVERETKTDEERPVVAGILWKRLETSGWLLQADATVQYAIAGSQLTTHNSQPDDWWPVLSKADLEIDSAYNSYIYDGLPPTPIANPGLSSIRAALNPVESDYWYYIHDRDGRIHYAETLEEHNRNVRVFL